MKSLFLMSAIMVCSVSMGQDPAPKRPLDEILKQLKETKTQQQSLAELAAQLTVEAQARMDEYKKTMEELTGIKIPVTPVGPVTPPVVVPDAFKDKITAAFKSDPGIESAKKADALSLWALYEAVSENQKENGVEKPNSSLCYDGAITTAGELIERVRATGKILAADRLPACRAAIAFEVQSVLGTISTPLTSEKRKAINETFAKTAVVLKGLSK